MAPVNAILRAPAAKPKPQNPMKTPLHVSHPRRAGVTLVEVIVIALISLVIMAFVLPMFRQKSSHSPTMDSLFDAKRINLALRMYADDHDGKFPFALADGSKLAAGIASNRALEQVFPKYTTSKKPFMNKCSAWCANPAADASSDDAFVLKRGQNDWLYVTGLKDDSDAAWPLIATATASANNLTYTNLETAKGGVWHGEDVIVGYADGSARLINGTEMDTTDKTRTFPKRKDTGGNLFIATPGWLNPGSVVLVPE